MSDQCPKCRAGYVDSRLGESGKLIVDWYACGTEVAYDNITRKPGPAREGLQCLKTQLSAAQAIVDKLPKCWRLDENGKRVCDVPVVPQMEVWFSGPDVDGVQSAIVRDICNRGEPGATDGTIAAGHPVDPEWMMLASECSATRAAAEAAAAEKEKT